MTPAARILLGTASFILGLSGLAHALAFKRALSAVTASGLAPFYGGSFLALWLIDSANCLILAALFAFMVAHPIGATRPVVFALALLPAASAMLIYRFLGNFYAGHLLLAAAIAALVATAGLQSAG
jgi:hypothetical protein